MRVPLDPGHLAEDKEVVFTWHYRYCETSEQVNELIQLFSYLSPTLFMNYK